MNLGSLGAGDSDARDVNNSGQVVGDSAGRAFLWQSGLGMIDLNSLLPAQSGWILEYAVGINDAGQIVGGGTLNGVDHSWMMTVPAPGTGAILLAALGFAVGDGHNHDARRPIPTYTARRRELRVPDGLSLRSRLPPLPL
jgi:probable HAF family extracellular repeat protein